MLNLILIIRALVIWCVGNDDDVEFGRSSDSLRTERLEEKFNIFPVLTIRLKLAVKRVHRGE